MKQYKINASIKFENWVKAKDEEEAKQEMINNIYEENNLPSDLEIDIDEIRELTKDDPDYQEEDEEEE